MIEPRSDAFVSDYFTDKEQELVARSAQDERFLMIAALWSAKESTLKALREGLRIDPRQVAVELQANPGDGSSAGGWRPLLTSYQQQTFHGWWRRDNNFVLTLVSEPECDPPTRVPITPTNRPK